MPKKLVLPLLFWTLGVAGRVLAADPPPPANLPFRVTWTAQSPYILYSVHFVDTARGWAVGTGGLGEGGLILATTDGGATWSSQRKAPDAILYSISFVDATTGWTVGEHGLILATSDGGRVWRPQSSGTEERLLAVHFVDPLAGWAVGDHGVILATSDGGVSWRRQTDGRSRRNLRSVHFVDSSSGWAVGTEGWILATRDGGASWRESPSGTRSDLNSVYFASPAVGWAVGADTLMLATVDGGRTWAKVGLRSSGQYSPALFSIHFANPNVGCAVGASNLVLVTGDGGKTWDGRIVGGADLFAVQIVDATAGWAVGGGGPAGGGVIWAIQDSGQTWKQRWHRTIDLASIDFVTPLAGWAVGPQGAIVATGDGGKTWSEQSSGIPTDLLAVRFVSPERGWSVGKNGVILATADGGRTWRPQDSRTHAELHSVHFASPTLGWAVGAGGTILATVDGGRTWTRQAGGGDDDLASVYFVSSTTGWTLGRGRDGEVMRMTRDGGRAWRRVAVHTDLNIESDPVGGIHFADSATGWAGNVSGLIRSRDGGVTWTAQQIPDVSTVHAVYFANAKTGWALGSFDWRYAHQQRILSTVDGGETWRSEVAGDAEFRSIRFAPGSTTGWAVLKGGLLKATLSDQAPYAIEPSSPNQPAGVLLRWTVRHRHPEQVRYELAYRTGDAEWSPLRSLHWEPRSADGKVGVRWNPAANSIQAGSSISYRLTLSGPEGLTYVQDLGPYVYRSWWSRQGTAARVGLAVAGLLAAYLLTCFALLWLRPLGLLWLGDHLDLRSLLELVPGNPLAPLLGGLFTATALPYFSRHSRTRRAWIAKYRRGGARFEDLQPPVRQAFVAAPDCLDAWIERRQDAAHAAFERIRSVAQRKVYIGLPLCVGTAEEGRRLGEPKPADFAPLLAPACAVLAILGEGGAGKSTLACQLGRWALADPPDRLAAHRMIPILIEEETGDLLAAVTGQLKLMVGAEEVEPDLVRELLRAKRLLVIVDALSERSRETQKHVQSIHQAAPINALVVTARRSPDFGPVAVTELVPEPLTTESLVYFLTEYLRRVQAAQLFPGRESLQLADRLLALVEVGSARSSATPLLVRLFIDQAISLRRSQQPIDILPASIPEVVLDYLRRTNPQDPATPNFVPDDAIIDAARVLGWCSLGDPGLGKQPPANALVPGDFYRDGAREALAARRLAREPDPLIDRLIANGVLRETEPAGTKILRFSLDPIAEYLAALHLIDLLRDAEPQWRLWLSHIETVDGFPQRVCGFLLALEDGIAAYRRPFAIPAIDLPWDDCRERRAPDRLP
jgi:photosystem II stability/assembly factor-like uncharacterized protein